MGWVVIVIICIVVFLFFILNTSSSRHSEKTTPRRTTTVVPPKRSSKEVEIRRLLDSAYTTNQRLTMKYETGNPPPGDPPIKIRDIDIYGLRDEYFEAYCHYRREVRIFRISRVLWARLSSERYEIPYAYAPSSWVTEGWGEIEDSKLEPNGETLLEPTNLTMSKDAQNKYEEDKRQRVSREAGSYGSSREGTKTYARYDWQKRFEESIRTPFPDEWSPALPYLYEAYRLEEGGADQEKIQKVLKKARQADKDATAFYLGRLSIIKKVRSERQRDRKKE
ncbi:hypothetical protein ES703_54347 [subsurface metagenome]